MSDATRPLTVAFVLVSYSDQAPAGMERATAALAHGLRQLGHRALILSAASRMYWLHDELRLDHPAVGLPCTDAELRDALLAAPHSIAHELDEVFDAYEVDVAVYLDALWGLGCVAPISRVRTVLAVHSVGRDEDLHPALDRADLVLAPSPTVLGHAAACGYDTRGWQVVPNALLHEHTPPPQSRREALRLGGPIRVLAGLGAEKNVRALLDAGRHVERPVQVITAEAGFKAADGAQAEELDWCRHLAAHLKLGVIHGGGLAWEDVLPWLAGAAVVIVPSVRENFGLVALEAMSVGTPVVAFDVGNLPALIGTGDDAGGTIVSRSSGEVGLWRAAERLLADPLRYYALTRAAYHRSRDYLPATVADIFVKVVLR